MTGSSDYEGQGPKPDYEVGYGRPPKATQFKPGQSGNAKGRKRKPKSVQAQVLKAVSKKVAVQEGGRRKLLPLQNVIIQSIVMKAAKADLKAAAFVFNLLKSPEYADTDTIDQDTLSAEDQVMFENMMNHFADADRSVSTELIGSMAEEGTLPEPDDGLDLFGTPEPVPEVSAQPELSLEQQQPQPIKRDPLAGDS